ncbi:MAG: hypothetical protein AB1430_00675 [Pseudomonadota bacterium]
MNINILTKARWRDHLLAGLLVVAAVLPTVVAAKGSYGSAEAGVPCH